MAYETFDIPAENFFEVLIVGGGPSGLAVASRLCESTPSAIFSDGEHQRFHWLNKRGNLSNIIGKNKRALIDSNKKFKPNDLLVLDKVSDSFMGQWDNQFDVVQIPHLRSPMFFHPDPFDIDALVAFAYGENRQDELMEIKGVVGKELTKHRQKMMRNKRKNSSSGKQKMDTSKPLKSPGYAEVDQRSWKDYYRPGTKLFKDFCQQLVDKYQLQNVVRKHEVVDVEYGFVNKVNSDGKVENGLGFKITVENGDVFGSNVAILALGPVGQINYPLNPKLDYQYLKGSCHTTDLFMRRQYFPTKSMMSKISDEKKSIEIVIVGGGLTSVQLCELALRKGISKVHLVTRGEIKIKHFDFHLEWVSKYQNYMKSTFWMKDSDEERFQMIEEAREGGSVNPQYHKVLMNLMKAGKIMLYKNSEIVDQVWNNETDDCWESIKIKNKMTKEETELHGMEYIYFATGSKADVNLPMLSKIIQEYPIKTIHGMPCLTDDLQWSEDLPLFVLGRLASLRTGPSSANLDGGRIGAERIGWKVQDMKRLNMLELEKEKVVSDEVSSGFENLLNCASGKVNWYTFLKDN